MIDLNFWSPLHYGSSFVLPGLLAFSTLLFEREIVILAFVVYCAILSSGIFLIKGYVMFLLLNQSIFTVMHCKLFGILLMVPRVLSI